MPDVAQEAMDAAQAVDARRPPYLGDAAELENARENVRSVPRRAKPRGIDVPENPMVGARDASRGGHLSQDSTPAVTTSDDAMRLSRAANAAS
jgi:hypothetical protein